MALRGCRGEGGTLGCYVGVWMKVGLGCVLLCVWSPVVSVCVCRRFLYTLVHLRDQQTVVHMNRMTEVLTVLLLL